MKNIAYLLCCLMPVIGFCQLNENFQDNDFTCSPTWNTSNLGADFIIQNQKLRSNSTVQNNSFFLSTVNKLALNAEWSINVSLQLATSGSNYCDIYLIADKADLKAPSVFGYFVRLGDTNDDISLFKRTGPLNSSVKIIDGINASLNPADTSVSLNIKRDMAGQFTLKRNINHSDWVNVGSAIDTAVRNSEFFGILIQQSSASFFYKHFFDDIQINALQDTIPPTLLSVSVKDSVSLELNFSEAMDTLSVKNLSNYLFNNAGLDTATDIDYDADLRHFLIRLSAPLSSGDYPLQLSNLKDLNGNPIQTATITFNYTVPYVPRPGDILINEIFADPSPVVGLPGFEFVELQNKTSHVIDLEGWSYSDQSSSAVFGKHLLNPGDYLILTSRTDTSHFKQFGPVLGITPWPSLNNSGDILYLKSPGGLKVDTVNYSDNWYGDAVKKQGGWSLERTVNYSPCDDVLNWKASIDAKGGTPGKINSFSNKLTVDSIMILSNRSIKLLLSKTPDTTSVISSGFNLDNLLVPLNMNISESFREITLTFERDFEEGTTYKLHSTSVKDCSGKPLDTLASKMTFFIDPIVEKQYPLVINEIFADPTPAVGLPESEFIELLNPTSQPISLEGLSFGNLVTEFSFKTGNLGPGEYLILCPARDTMLYKPYGKVAGIPGWPSINNTGATLVLKNNKGRIIHQVTFDIKWYREHEKKNGGYSLELIDPASLCNINQNWKVSQAPEGGTPGKQNSVYIPFGAAVPLKVIGVRLVDGITVQINFNKPIDSLKANNAANFNLNNGAGRPSQAYAKGPNFDEVILKYPVELARPNTYTVSVSGITDCSGNRSDLVNSQASFFYPKDIASQDILISEILFNPRPGGADFLEIYNNSIFELDLRELSIGRITDTLRDLKSATNEPLLFKPGDYLALTVNPENLKKEYSIESANSLVKVTSLPPFNNDEGQVVIMSGTSQIDMFRYSSNMHSPLYKDPEGVSLERSSFQISANSPGNFKSATAAAGYATPGYKNSQTLVSQNTSEEFIIRSMTFSPDNDGFEDEFSLEYNLPGPGYIANITVYNDKGQAVRHLLRNFVMNSSGIINWDGLNEHQSVLSAGIYLFDMELYNMEGNKKRFRKAIALAKKI